MMSLKGDDQFYHDGRYCDTVMQVFLWLNRIKAQLFKSFKFSNGSRMSDKNLVIIGFKYLQKKKWWKQAVKSARIKMSYKIYWLFSFHPYNWWKPAIFLKKLAIFIQHLPHFSSIHEAPWMQIFVFLQPMWRQEQSDLSASRTFQPLGD